MAKILDVGCGNNKKQGAVGIDIVDLPEVDIVHNLNEYPWPVNDNEFDRVILDDIIEHLQNPIKVMEEVYRILKADGYVFLRIVYWSHRYAFSDPTHVKFFSEMSIDFLCGKIRPYYTKARFEIIKFDYIYDKNVKRIVRSTKLLNFLGYFLNNVKQGMVVLLQKID